MARRTKADAEVTRHRLLDAAEQLFQARGVSRTSLNDIATAAGTSRGAIYWHFKDKADLFNAMMERVTLPFEQTLSCLVADAAQLDGPLMALRTSMINALYKTANDEQTRRVFEVATHQVEYTEEMRTVREGHLRVRNECVVRNAKALDAAAQRIGLRLPMPLNSAALGLYTLIDGLIQNWLLDTEAFDLVACGEHTIDAYLRGLGFSLDAVPAPHQPEVRPSRASAGAALPAPSDSPTRVRSRTQTA